GLLPGDVNGAPDFYLWRGGHLYRLPGAVDKFQGAATLSHHGSSVAFITATPLLPQDGDSSADLYVARVGGGYPNPPTPPACAPADNCHAPPPCAPAETCRAPPPPAPAAPNAGSESATGANVSEPPACRKGFSRKHGKCVKPRRHGRHKKHAKQAHRTRHANTDRRAAKRSAVTATFIGLPNPLAL